MIEANCTAQVAIKQRSSEQAYVIDALKRLRRLGVKCRREVALMGRSADLVFMHEDQLHSVEFKLHDWRRALNQARDHRIGVERAYVCMPGRPVTQAMMDEASVLGIGFLLYQDDEDWPFSVILPAEEREVAWPIVRARLLNTLQ